MNTDDIEILDDFSGGETPSNPVPNQPSAPAPVAPAAPEPAPTKPGEPPAILWDEEPAAPVTPEPSANPWDPEPAAPVAPVAPVVPETPAPAPTPDPLMEIDAKPIPEFEPVSAPTPDLGPAPESVSEFEKMVNEAPTVASEEPKQEANSDLYYVPPSAPESNPAPNNQSYENGFNSSDYAGDANNDLVQSNGDNTQDLTITAVYPNGLAVDKNEEIENTQVIKPKKKGSGDLPLIIIVAVLAITLVVLLIVFYL